MSDTFDHMGDAFDSYDRSLEDGEGWHSPTNWTVFHKDELYYHDKYDYEELVFTTDKACLFQIKGKKYWVPKNYAKSWILRINLYGYGKSLIGKQLK